MFSKYIYALVIRHMLIYSRNKAAEDKADIIARRRKEGKEAPDNVDHKDENENEAKQLEHPVVKAEPVEFSLVEPLIFDDNLKLIPWRSVKMVTKAMRHNFLKTMGKHQVILVSCSLRHSAIEHADYKGVFNGRLKDEIPWTTLFEQMRHAGLLVIGWPYTVPIPHDVRNRKKTFSGLKMREKEQLADAVEDRSLQFVPYPKSELAILPGYVCDCPDILRRL